MNFFDFLIAFFLRQTPEERIKKKRLAALKKAISRDRRYFYDADANVFLQNFAAHFYEIYRVLAGAQLCLRKLRISAEFKVEFFKHFLNDEQSQLLDALNEENILRNPLMKNGAEECVAKQLQNFKDGIDAATAEKIDSAYSFFLQFRSLALYDYYVLLRKFCPEMREYAFAKAPNFRPVSASQVQIPLEDYLSIENGLAGFEKWDEIFKTLENFCGHSPVDLAEWEKFSAAVERRRKSRIFEKILAFAKKDPNYEVRAYRESGKIAASVVAKIGANTVALTEKLERAKKAHDIAVRVSRFLKRKDGPRLMNYNAEKSDDYASYGVNPLKCAASLNFLQAFLCDYIGDDARILADSLLVRAQWILHDYANEISSRFYAILDVSHEIEGFDESAGIGKLDALVVKSKRSPELLRRCNAAAESIDVEAFSLLKKAGDAIASFLQILRSLRNDLENGVAPVKNWQEVEKKSPRPVKLHLQECIKNLEEFCSLLEIWTSGEGLDFDSQNGGRFAIAEEGGLQRAAYGERNA